MYTTADGLPHNEINRIVRDSRGFLWFCTADGLARFDGYTFTNFGTDQGLPHANVTDLLETRGGRYWVATGGGLVRFDPGGTPGRRVVSRSERTSAAVRPMFTVIPAEDEDEDPRARSVTVLLEDKSGTIWCGTEKGLCRLDEAAGRPIMHPVNIGIPREDPEQGIVSDIVEDRGGTLWIATHKGLYRRSRDGSSARYTVRDGLPDDFLHDLLEDHLGRLWAGTRAGGFFQFTSGDSHGLVVVARSYTLWDLVHTGWVFQLLETADHRFWIATNVGLLEFFPDADTPGRRFRLYTTSHGLSFHEITALNEDASGNLWLGTNTAGAMKLARNGFITYGEQDGVSGVNAIFEDQRGGLCLRGAQGGAYDAHGRRHQTALGRFDGRKFSWFRSRAIGGDIGWVVEKVTLQTSTGEWWVGTGTGVYRFPAAANFAEIASAQPIARYTTKDGLAAPQVFRLFEDSRGDVWVSTISSAKNGLARWERASDTWRNLENDAGLASLEDDLPRSFGEDRTGNVWIGFKGALARYGGGRFTWFRGKEGVPARSAIANMHLDRAGRLWLASSQNGLIRIDAPGSEHPSFTSYTTADGLSSNRTEVITEDFYGRLYVGTGRGLDRLDPLTDRIKHFTTADGLAPGMIRAAFRDRTGALWFGMTRGMSQLVPAREEPATAPPILVNALVVAGTRRDVSPFGERSIKLPDLDYDRNQIQIEFVGLDFAPGEALRYQHKLEGADREWSALSEQRSIGFANLAPGQYKFLVRAVSSDGTASAVPATVTFRILPPIWRRWWFVALVAIVAGLIAYAFYRNRVARLVELERMRTRIATDLHDDIGSSLSRVAILSEVAKKQIESTHEEAGRIVADIAATARGLIEATSDMVWSIDPRSDDLENLAARVREFASSMLEAKRIAWELEVPAELARVKLSPQQRRHLFLIFKEAIHNAVRHAQCRSVALTIAVEDAQLRAEIRDDGQGLAATATGAAQRQGHGLESMRARAAELGGSLTIGSAPGGGTRVRVQMPLRAQGA